VATKLDLLLDFTNGQGVSGGPSNYVNYPADLDTNFNAIQSTVNTIIDEVNTARLNDNQLIYDLMIDELHESSNGNNGRLSPWYGRVTFSGANATVTSGPVYCGGRRIVIVGAVLAHTGGATADNYISTDENGNLFISTAAGQHFFDIARLAASGGNFTALSNDYLAIRQGLPLISADTANKIYQRFDGSGNDLGRQDPAIRSVQADGTLGDAGFHNPAQDVIEVLSQWSGGHRTGSPTSSQFWRALGQIHLMEQARIHAIKSGAAQSIATGATFAAVTWDTPVANAAAQRTWRREPATYFTNPFISASGATLTIPASTDLDGTYLWTAHLTLATAGTTTGYVEARIRATSGTATDIALCRVAAASTGDTTLCLSGMMDLASGATIQLQVRHGDPGSINLSAARITGLLVGGPV